MNPSDNIDKRIKELSDWRGEVFTQLRKIINAADPAVKEDWKWDTAVWVQNGMVCAVAAFKDHVKVNFFKGAKLTDPHKLINNGLESKSQRAVDFHEGDKIDEAALTDLIREAISLNKK